MKENNFSILTSRKQSIIKSLFTFFVVSVPALLLWIFFSKDFPFAEIYGIQFDWWLKLIIALVFILGTLLITLLFIYLKILDISILIFSLPVSICFMVIFVTDQLEPWVRALIIVPFVLMTLPIAILVKKIELKILVRRRSKNNENKKIIGYKDNR